MAAGCSGCPQAIRASTIPTPPVRRRAHAHFGITQTAKHYMMTAPLKSSWEPTDTELHLSSLVDTWITKWALHLYVAGMTPGAKRARENILAICEG